MQQGSGGFQLWVGNAPFDATEEELKSVLSLGSKVLNVRVKYDSESGQSKGFAFVEFPDAESCLLLLQHHQQQPLELRGRRLKVDWATAELREVYGHRVAAGGGGATLSASQSQGAAAAADSVSSLKAKAGTGTDASNSGARGGERVPWRGESVLNAGAVSLTAVAPRDPFAASPAALPVVISEIMQCMSTAQLLLLLQEFQQLSLAQPQLSRSLLTNNPSLAYALVYAMFLTGATSAAQLRAEKTQRQARVDQGQQQQTTRPSSPPPSGEVSFDAVKKLTASERRQLKRNRAERLQQLEGAALLPTRHTAAASPSVAGGSSFNVSSNTAALSSAGSSPKKANTQRTKPAPGASAASPSAGAPVAAASPGSAPQAKAPSNKASSDKASSNKASSRASSAAPKTAPPKTAAATEAGAAGTAKAPPGAGGKTSPTKASSSKAPSNKAPSKKEAKEGKEAGAASKSPGAATGRPKPSPQSAAPAAARASASPSQGQQGQQGQQGVSPSSARSTSKGGAGAGADEVVKSPAMLANVLSASPASMAKWTEAQRRQVMALQAALLRRGFEVAS